MPSDALGNVFTCGLVFLGTFYALSALDVPGHPRVWEGLTKSLEAEMVFPDIIKEIKENRRKGLGVPLGPKVQRLQV